MFLVWHVIGGVIDDVLKGHPVTDIMRDRGGNDKVFGLGGDDNIDAGVGRDYVIGGKGSDKLFGGFGRDVFKFQFGDGDFNATTKQGDMVLDYRDGVDRFDVPEAGLRAVDLEEVNGGTVVTYNGGSFFVKDYHKPNWSHDDFI
jgi:Ca2+-binding RTX toxin-like protein